MKRSKIRGYKSYCSEPLDKIEHYEEALAENFKGWCIHHRLEIQQDGTRVFMKELIDQNLYYGRPASELVFMKVSEHMTLHSTGNKFFLGKHHSAETLQKMSEAKRGKNHPFFGKHHSEESRKKTSEAVCGMLWWNNGISNKRCRECPGPEWKRGRI